MKNQSRCNYISLDDPETKRILSQNEGRFKRERDLSENNRVIINVSWNKEKMSFNCSIAFPEKEKDGTWKCVVRFDDAHECRHVDIDLPMGRTKIIDGRLALIKVECPILSKIINSLPKERADAWKMKLFEEIIVGNQKHEEYLNDPEKIHFY